MFCGTVAVTIMSAALAIMHVDYRNICKGWVLAQQNAGCKQGVKCLNTGRY